MQQEKTEIISNARDGPAYYRIRLACGPEYMDAQPGQFVTLRLLDEISPLLRRPFSIHRLVYDNNRVTGIEILYKVIGGFTQKLSRVRAGERLDLLGPLGHGFTVSKKYRKTALIAGGIGVAPLVFLAERLAEAAAHAADSIVFIGGRSSTDILCRSIFKSLEMNIHTTTEDGTDGEKGLVTQALERWLKKNRADMIYACGPIPMLRRIANIAETKNIPCEVSIETVMACGLGVCLGCAIKTSDKPEGYQHVCRDGPVFDASALTL
jgi:dihydroorotate dehydrogenase electron transfer subunit